MDIYDTAEDPANMPPVTELTRAQRRALGVLVEKAFTTADSYPLTLKALTTGCNQKSNRSPVTNYSEEEMYNVLDELRTMGLVAMIHSSSGRTERYRHYMRKRFDFSEPQLAVMTELLLRGRQTMGELRARASRMVQIGSLNDLRTEVQGLINQGYIQSTDALERRGVEVNHSLYTEQEKSKHDLGGTQSAVQVAPVGQTLPDKINPTTIEQQAQPDQPHNDEIENLKQGQRELQDELDELRKAFVEIEQRFDDLRHQLGG